MTMARDRLRTAILAAALAVAPATSAAGLVTKTYEFKANTPLEVGLDLGGSLRLESIEIVAPAAGAAGGTPVLEEPKARVIVSNLGTESAKVGIAMAVLDGDGRLVAAGSGGTRMFPLRGGRRMTYTVAFDDVYAAIGRATAFMISLETTP